MRSPRRGNSASSPAETSFAAIGHQNNFAAIGSRRSPELEFVNVIIAEELPARHRGWGIGILGALVRLCLRVKLGEQKERPSPDPRPDFGQPGRVR